jgi:hypothetical protein
VKLIAQVRDKETSTIAGLFHGVFLVRVSPFLLSEVFDAPFIKPDGRTVRMTGYDVWLNEETGEYEAAPQFTESDT